MSYEYRRHLMVQDQLRGRGIRDERVLAAMEAVPRHMFISGRLQDNAYDDCALPIGEGQTISQPYMVALMTELLELKGDEKVLEIGTGSGYQTAVLAMLASEVFSIERVHTLSLAAGKLFEKLEYRNVQLIVSDGTLGLPEQSPYDSIIVTAAAPEVPECYLEQLKDNGRLVIPVGSRYSQVLYQIRKTSSGLIRTASTPCVFVPLIGEKGWEDTDVY